MLHAEELERLGSLEIGLLCLVMHFDHTYKNSLDSVLSLLLAPAPCVCFT